MVKKTERIEIEWGGKIYGFLPKSNRYYVLTFKTGRPGWSREKSTKEEFDNIAEKRSSLLK